MFSLFKKKEKDPQPSEVPKIKTSTSCESRPPSKKPVPSCIPSKRGLSVGEILLLDYCNKYPLVDKEYPKFWADRYGIKDVNRTLKDLEIQKFIELDQNQRYRLTELGEKELDENGYVPYMHKCKQAISPDFDVWSINHKLKGDTSDWRRVTFKEHLKEVNRLLKTNKKSLEELDPRTKEGWEEYPESMQQRFLELYELNGSKNAEIFKKNIETFSKLAAELKVKIKELDQ